MFGERADTSIRPYDAGLDVGVRCIGLPSVKEPLAGGEG
jgi:hypothetical protein